MSARDELAAIARSHILSPPDHGFMTDAIADAVIAAGYVKASEAAIERASVHAQVAVSMSESDSRKVARAVVAALR